MELKALVKKAASRKIREFFSGGMDIRFYYLRSSGFIIYTIIPNTKAQETDQRYSPFKSKFAKNLRALSDACINEDFPTSLPPWMVGLLVFGGTDPVSQFVVSESALNLVSAGKRI